MNEELFKRLQKINLIKINFSVYLHKKQMLSESQFNSTSQPPIHQRQRVKPQDWAYTATNNGKQLCLIEMYCLLYVVLAVYLPNNIYAAAWA